MLDKTYITPEAHEALSDVVKSLDGEIKLANEEIVKGAIAQKEFRGKFSAEKPMDAASREQLERLKSAQFERGDKLTALKKERQMYDYEVVSESPVSKTDLARAMAGATKSATQRRGFPEDELASEEASLATKSGLPTMVDTIGAWLGSLNDGRGLDRFFRNDGTGSRVATFKARYGDRAAATPADETMFDVSGNSSAIKEAVKSGFTTSPNNPGFPFGGAVGNLGIMCGWVHLDINALIPFPENCVLDSFTNKTETGASFVTFDRQLAATNGFAPVAESIVAGLTAVQSANKPFIDFGFLTVQVPLVSIAGLYSISEEALKKCPQSVERIKQTADKQFHEREAIQMLQGTGAGGGSPQLLGLLNQPGIQSHVFRAAPYNQLTDNIPDAVIEAYTAAMLLGCRPDTLIIHPNDALKVKTQKDSQGRPLYFAMCKTTGELFCIDNVCETPYTLQGTSIVTSKANVIVVDDGEIEFAVGYINDDFRQNLKRLRWERMLALLVARPECVVRTGGLVQ